MSFKEIIQNIQLSWFQRQARRIHTPISFAEQLPATRSILVLLPPEKNHFDAVIGEMAYLQKIFPAASITLVHYQQNSMPSVGPQRFTVVQWRDENVTRWGAPTADFKNKLFSSPYDVLIDLDPDFNFFFLCLVRASGAPIRVGFAQPQREEVYNMLYRPKSIQDLAKITRSLLKYLSLLSSGASR